MLTGTLDDFTLPDVLRLIAAAGRTGRLDVARDAGSGRLFFHEGAVHGAARAGSAAAAPEDLAFDLMRWDRGEFSWEPGAASEPSSESARVAVEDLLDRVTRRLEELAEIKTLVPSEDAVLVMAPQPPQGAVQINITPGEWRVLVMVDGHRPVHEIALASGLDDIAAMKVLYGLAAAGLVTVAGGVVPQIEAQHDAEAQAEPEPEPEPVPDESERWTESPPPATAPLSGTPLLEEVSDPPDTTVMSDVSDVAADERVYSFPGESQEEDGQAAPTAALETAPDPFLSELAHEPASPFPTGFGAPSFGVSPEVDRSTAARELAGLFDEGPGVAGLGAAALIAAPPAPPRPRRVEDDDQVTRGLISRLIDGVKGL